ncbi:hypothetical protein K491DRAFT_310910 [Lophiostoma macrostomum CBS 122681]|uniref:Uncharacterized protein n=1 Tax=Lophiostoma macrostomum CBS 122681 TaxID=1314788 RepID=A0A6A6SMJ0_9PLEO|nr:hypothetical protein K491DRAFT_310910 [Lophiostoma macrostomum CBS 122681]
MDGFNSSSCSLLRVIHLELGRSFTPVYPCVSQRRSFDMPSRSFLCLFVIPSFSVPFLCHCVLCLGFALSGTGSARARPMESSEGLGRVVLTYMR